MLDKIKGGIYGLLIGDAVGVPYEFNTPSQLPSYHLIDMQPPSDFARTYPDVEVGTWSDDGAQALCLLASLLHSKDLDVIDLTNRFSNWYQLGYMAIDFKVFDVGVQTAYALNRYKAGYPIAEIASDDEKSNGNGALMRTLPLALWHKGSDQQLIENAFQQSHITHAHIRSKICCAIYCLWTRNILKNMDVNQAFDSSILDIFDYFKTDLRVTTELKEHICIESDFKISGSGYVVDCLFSAKFALQQSTYEDVIKTAISLGNDTDTTACVAGGLAGIIYGYNKIPKRWQKDLKGSDIVDPLIDDLMHHLDN